MRRARSSASVAVVWSVVCAIGARAAWGQMRPAPGDTYANSEYYIRDVGVEVSDLHGGNLFTKEARHERPDVPEMFLRSKIPLEVRWTTTRTKGLRHVTFGRHARAGRARLSVQSTRVRWSVDGTLRASRNSSCSWRHQTTDEPRAVIFLRWNTDYSIMDSQRMLTLAFGILLTEKLGYRSNTSRGFLPGQELLDDHTVTARSYQNVLHGKSMFDLELWPVSGKRKTRGDQNCERQSFRFLCNRRTRTGCRNGWFVDASSVDDPSTWHSLPLLNASGAFNASSSKRLMLSRELPVFDLRTSFRAVDTALCGSNATFISRYGGILDCVTGSWAPNNAMCCTRYLNRTSACTSSMQPCVAFVQNTPAWLKSEHERRVSSSGLPLEIVYANALQTSADAASGSSPMPVLFYWWEPDLGISPKSTFGSPCKILCTAHNRSSTSKVRRRSQLATRTLTSTTTIHHRVRVILSARLSRKEPMNRVETISVMPLPV